MSIKTEGLSGSDIHAYYTGAVLDLDGGLFKVSEYRDRKLRGYKAKGGVWVPTSVLPSAVSVKFPQEGYVEIEDNIHKAEHIIRRTRRKGFTNEVFKLHPMVNSVNRVPIDSIDTLSKLFQEPAPVMYEEAQLRLKRKSCRGVALSRVLCIVKRGASREVHLRSKRLGVIKKGGLELPRKYDVFRQELEEYHVPITTLRSTNEVK